MKSCVLLLYLDAFKYDYLKEAPFLSQLGQKGISGQLESILAYDGLGATIFSGFYPETHGIWTIFLRDPRSSPFRWTLPLHPLLNLFDFAAQKHYLISSGVSFTICRISKYLSSYTRFPSSVMIPQSRLYEFDLSLKKELHEPHAICVPTLFDILTTMRMRFQVLENQSYRSLLKQPLPEDPNVKLLLIHITDMDRIGHKFGPDSPERRQATRELDSTVDSIVSNCRKAFDRLFVFAFADHGMLKVRSTLNIISILRSLDLKEGSDYSIFLDSTMARFWCHNSDSSETILETFRNIPGHVLTLRIVCDFTYPPTIANMEI